MVAMVIPSDRLAMLRQQRGLVSFSWRHCYVCSRRFRTAKAAQCICDKCRGDINDTNVLELGR